MPTKTPSMRYLKHSAMTKESARPLVRTSKGHYQVNRRQLSEADILAAADEIIERHFKRLACIKSTEQLKLFLRSKLALHKQEQFGCLFLDSAYRVIAWEVLFVGTVNECAAHPREIVKRAIAYDSVAVIFAHQHPSGDPTPSPADEHMTRKLRQALQMFDIKVLDHVIVGGNSIISLAERGQL